MSMDMMEEKAGKPKGPNIVPFNTFKCKRGGRGG